eukprot:CAMPEP_0119492508 /NCGR_PEP_ID=MMETSP1344-20130328/17036_1 /TAXON_ID=236787 /ORGANISM="Florenciella parvula, Strain CCMP2471" /LENGTH=396 /DNA_ID=CAMNT_0007527847 /DNA_START=108 /DNA_END=1294 /DNA_ORIENTATION=-
MADLRRKAKDNGVEKRILILDQNKCKPNSEAFAYLKRYAGSCGKECITVIDTPKLKRAKISEEICAQCLNRAKKCPGDAVHIVKLPSNLETDCTHRYGPNHFKLHGLPTPRPGHVLGVLGTNGIGKSTALSILAGRVKPNLGRFMEPPDWYDIIQYYRGSDLQNYFTALVEDKLRVAVKPQLDTTFVKPLVGRKVGELLEERDQRGKLQHVAEMLQLDHLLDHEIQNLSGGELQRFAIARTALVDADVYMFDEASSFLDVKQRLRATDVIRELVEVGQTDSAEEAEALAAKIAKRYVIVVEHDLAILDNMSDFVCCLYGEPGAYGVVTKRASVRNGINHYLAGYIPAENMRFRAHAITFRVQSGVDAENTAAAAAVREDQANKAVALEGGGAGGGG